MMSAKGNEFLHISNYQEAQILLSKQLDVRFAKILDGFVPIVFPMLHNVLRPHLSYYRTMWQSERAADLIFTSPGDLNSIMDSLLRHANVTGTSTHVLCYLDRLLTLAGKPYGRSKDEVLTRVTDFNDGIRVCLTNKMLRQNLSDSNFGSERTQKQLSAKIGRHLRSLRPLVSVALIREYP